MSSEELFEIQRAVDRFNCARPGWAAVHSPRNLAIAVASEAGELLQLYRWADDACEATQPDRDDVLSEVADVAIFLAGLCNALGESLSMAVDRKLAVNERRYPPYGLDPSPER